MRITGSPPRYTHENNTIIDPLQRKSCSPQTPSICPLLVAGLPGEQAAHHMYTCELRINGRPPAQAIHSLYLSGWEGTHINRPAIDRTDALCYFPTDGGVSTMQCIDSPLPLPPTTTSTATISPTGVSMNKTLANPLWLADRYCQFAAYQLISVSKGLFRRGACSGVHVSGIQDRH